ncbi:MAG: ABC transporter permease [Bacillota bacterium]
MKAGMIARGRDKGAVARFRAAVRVVFSSWTATVGFCLIAFWVLGAVFAPVLAPYDPLEQDIHAINTGPSAAHPLGTDDLGRDLLSRLLYGARPVLLLAPLSVLLSLMAGAAMGLASGYYGGWTDEVVMRVVDAMMAFPPILIYLVIIAAVGPSATNVVLAIVLAGAPGIAKLVRSLTLDVRTREYVAAAKLRGESPLYIMVAEILLNTMGPVLVDAMLRVGYAVIAIGTLGFLGLGLPPPYPDWGSMVARARRQIWLNPWAVLWPTLSISTFVVGLNLLVDGIREKA